MPTPEEIETARAMVEAHDTDMRARGEAQLRELIASSAWAEVREVIDSLHTLLAREPKYLLILRQLPGPMDRLAASLPPAAAAD